MMQQRREGGDGRGEVRRIHVVYFLSSNGRTDQPHLMRVHHRHGDGGVRLSDVKRWLSELRGKYMPDSYCWSYKRRYKTGYVWQDLTGDDLITPIDDNEYVLKGSLISPDEDNNKKPCKNQKPTVTGDPDRSALFPPETAEEVVDDDEEASPKPSPPTPHDDDDSPCPPPSAPPPPTTTTTYADASTQTPPTTATPRRATAVFKLDLPHQNQTSSCETETEPEGKKKKTTTTPASPSSSLGKSKSRSGGKGMAAYMFRNLITCGDMEACDSAAIMLPVNRRETPPPPENHIRNRESFGEKMAGEFGKKGTGCRLGEPYCSRRCRQCGKAFKPEKFHSHMKSCRAVKGKERRSSRSETTPGGPAEDGLSKDMISTFLLAH